MQRFDRFAIILCLLSLWINWQVSEKVFENVPHLEDEMTYAWQAAAMAKGQLLLPSPPSPQSFMVPFVIDHQGWRFGKYPLGFPAVLSLGVHLGLRSWVNPLLATVSLWLIYCLGKKVFDPPTALLAACLTAASPFFIINSADLLSHAWSLFLSCAIACAWLDLFYTRAPLPRSLLVCVAGMSLGALALTRPLTAVGVGLPFVIDGLRHMRHGSLATRKSLCSIAALAGLIACVHFLWQAVLTGSPWINPYTLWWPFDTIGFGAGVGIRPGGHTPGAALNDALFSLSFALHDGLGWPYLSWVFLPFGVLAIRHHRPAQLLAAVFPSLVFVYLFYWVGAWLLGPRYYYEGLYSLTLLSAAGIMWILRRIPHFKKPIALLWTGHLRRFYPPTAALIAFSVWVGLLFTVNVALYTPLRLRSLTHLYGIQRSQLAPFEGAHAASLAPALIIVHAGEDWRQYATFLELENPTLDSPILFALSIDEPADQALIEQFPQRQVFHYYPDRPGELFHFAQH